MTRLPMILIALFVCALCLSGCGKKVPVRPPDTHHLDITGP